MPRKYTKMPKGWVMVEVKDDEVEEVWEKQKQALSDSITLGRLTWLASRSLLDPCPLSLPDLKRIAVLSTFPSTLSTGTGSQYLPNTSRSR